jgi:hypothetical protein
MSLAADIAVVTATHMVCAAPHKYMKMRRALREVWDDDQVKGDFQDLIDWRDRVLAEHFEQ